MSKLFFNKLSAGVLASLFIGGTAMAENITVNSFKANIVSRDLQITAVEATVSCEKKGLLGGTSDQSSLADVAQAGGDTYSVTLPRISVSALGGYSQCSYAISFEAGGRVSTFVIAKEGLKPGQSKLNFFNDAQAITTAMAKHLNGAELIKDDSKLGGASLQLPDQSN